METEAENQTNTGTDSYTYINRQELSHNCYTPTHPAHADWSANASCRHKYATTESHADTHTGLSDLASHAPVHLEASQHLSLAADDTEVRSLAMLASGDSWAFCWPTICNVLNVFIAFHIFYDVSQGSLLWERLTSDTINVNQSSGCWTDRQLTDQHHWGY